MRGTILFCVGFFGLAVGCGGGGGSDKPVEAPDPAEEAAIDDEKTGAKPKEDTGEEGQGEGEGEEGKGKAAAEPEFKDGMSVEEAISAVPQGTPRMNVEQEELGKPLMKEELYKPCKPAQKDHFKVKVAIWEGKAVGIDVTATPKNPKLEQCVKDQIKTVTWKQSVKSLNTVEYQF